jgi:uncharacterized repeat protein (TIGR04052 family)
MQPRKYPLQTVIPATLIAFALCLSIRAHATGGFDANGQCVGDQNGDGEVTVDELIIAVNNALSGCQFTPVTLQFRGMVGDQPFVCGNIYHNIGTTNGDIVPSDFRLYIHNIRLVTADGKEAPLKLDQDGIWQYSNLAMLDFENKVQPCNAEGTTLTNTVVHGMAAPGTYTGVRFLLGVPFNLNHANAATAASPLNLSAMFWSWQDGYKFLRIDTAFDNLRVHLGSIGCQTGPGGVTTGCSRPNVGEVNLDNFNPATSVIDVDIAALLSDSDINSNQVNTAPGCQSEANDLDCVPIFKNLGVNFDDGSPNPTSQKFFRVE